MKKTVYEINEQGFLIELHVEEVNDTNYIIVDLPNGLFKPRFVNGEWVEGATKEEIDSIVNSPKIPSEMDRLRLEIARGNAEMFETMLAIFKGGI